MCRRRNADSNKHSGRVSFDDILDEDGKFDLEKARRTGGIMAIKRLTFFRSGRVKSVELRDRNYSLELMGKHHTIWTGDEDPDEALKRYVEALRQKRQLPPGSQPSVPGEVKRS
jgi:hypothetical protein